MHEDVVPRLVLLKRVAQALSILGIILFLLILAKVVLEPSDLEDVASDSSVVTSTAKEISKSNAVSNTTARSIDELSKGIEVLSSNQKLLDTDDRSCIVIEDLKIKAPIVEGTTQDALATAVGHFNDTGEFGKGNYCVAGHCSEIYDCVFNNLKDIKIAMPIELVSEKGDVFKYYVTDKFIVEPDEVWVLSDSTDATLTIVTCADEGRRRLIVKGTLMDDAEFKEFQKSLTASKRSDIVGIAESWSKVNVSDYFEGVSKGDL